MEIEKKMEEKYYEMQFYDSEIKKIQKKIEKLDEQMENINFVKNSISEFKEVEEGTEILVPITNGIFAKAKLVDNKRFRVNVGNNINVDKSIEDTDEMMNKHLIEVIEYREKLYQSLEILLGRAEKLEEEINDITKSFEKEKKDV